ncbi:unnamed protein product, partial [Symbiodinium necroappetens]
MGYSWLAFSSFCENRKTFKLRPKLHVWLHLWHRCATCRLNPQLNACFADEDFVRIMCNVDTGSAHKRFEGTTGAPMKFVLTSWNEGFWMSRWHRRPHRFKAIPGDCLSR